MQSKTIGVMTGGGDCPGLNAVIRSVVLSAHQRGWQVLGIEDATAGLVDLDYRGPDGNRYLTPRDVRHILRRGGTVLGTSNRSDPFRFVVERNGERVETDISDRVVDNYRKLGLGALISIGGDGSMAIARRLADKGLDVIGVPKTIDQDVEGTDTTFGFQTAVQTVTQAIDALQDTAESHDRVMVVEVMGRDAGWIALHGAIAGGAHVCLIPEIPFRLDRVIDCVRQRQQSGAPFCIVVVAEGARRIHGDATYLGEREPGAMRRLGGVGYGVAEALAPALDLDVRVTVLGHVQRGGSPVPVDRVLGTRFGVAAVEAAARGDFGQMVALRHGEVVTVPLADATKGQRLVDPLGELVATGRAVGLEFGAPALHGG